MAGFGLGKGGVIKDSSFVYIEWEGKDSPKHNAAIKDLIEDLDEEHFLDTGTMEDGVFVACSMEHYDRDRKSVV